MQQKTQKCRLQHVKPVYNRLKPAETDTNSDITGISAEIAWLQGRVTCPKKVRYGIS